MIDQRSPVATLSSHGPFPGRSPGAQPRPLVILAAPRGGARAAPPFDSEQRSTGWSATARRVEHQVTTARVTPADPGQSTDEAPDRHPLLRDRQSAAPLGRVSACAPTHFPANAIREHRRGQPSPAARTTPESDPTGFPDRCETAIRIRMAVLRGPAGAIRIRMAATKASGLRTVNGESLAGGRVEVQVSEHARAYYLMSHAQHNE